VISLYRPGNSLLHRMPVGIKLLALIFVLAMLTIGTDLWWVALARAFAVVALYFLASFGFKELGQQVWRIKLLVLFVLVPGLVFQSPLTAVTNTLALVYGILVATLVTMTTKSSAIVDLIARITKSRSFALLIALSLNSVALVSAYANQIVDASKARGVRPKPIRQVVNLFVISLRNADQYGEALAARGVEA